MGDRQYQELSAERSYLKCMAAVCIHFAGWQIL